MKWIFFLLLLLAGCGSGAESQTSSDDNHGYGWNYDLYSEAPDTSGLRVRHQPDAHLTEGLSFYESSYRSARKCVADAGVLVPENEPRPLVVIVRGLVEQPSINGKIYHDTHLILLTDDYYIYSYRHELIHHFLVQSGIPSDAPENASHQGAIWGACGNPWI